MTYIPLEQAVARENEKAVVNSAPLPEQAPPAKDMETRMAELAKMTPLDYERVREAEAKALGVRVSILDREVEARRPKSEDETAEPFEDVEPWPEAVDGAALAEEIRDILKSYVVFAAPGDADVTALWTIGTYLMDTWRLWPRLMITSPTKQCGKSTLLETLDALVFRGLIVSNTKAAGVFRAIEAWRPSLLLDEADTWMKDDQELAGILNSGHTRRTARVVRVVEKGGELVPVMFSTWTAMAIAGIGHQRDTLMSRSIVIGLRRKLSVETVERLPFELHDRLLIVRRQIARWVTDNTITIAALDIEPMECGNDRRRDNFTPLHRLAHVLGGAWPERLATAYAAKSTGEDDAEEPAGVMLLRDIVDIFTERHAQRLQSTDLITALCDMEERPWAEWRRGNPLTAQTIAKLLRPFEVRPRNAKTLGRVLKTYHLEDIQAAYERYSAKTPENYPATPLPS